MYVHVHVGKATIVNFWKAEHTGLGLWLWQYVVGCDRVKVIFIDLCYVYDPKFCYCFPNSDQLWKRPRYMYLCQCVICVAWLCGVLQSDISIS